MVELRTLGEFSVSEAGDRVRLGTRKEYALLVYLALRSGRVLRREQVATLLWEEASESRARHCLSQTLYGLRRRIGGLRLQTGGDELWLPADEVRVDLLALRCALEEDRLADAAALYRGAFLDGFWVPDAAEFEAWQETTRAEARRSAFGAIRRLLQRAERAGDWPETERQCSRLLELDPLDEVVHRTRIRAIAAAGDRRGALFEYRRVRRRLMRDLDREPTPETVRLGERLRRTRWVPSGDGAKPEAAAPATPFVGRGEEFRRLRDEWRCAKAGRGRVVVISGPAGVGKSRFCRRFLRLGALQGARLFNGRCHPHEGRLPYSGAVDALADGLRPDDMDRLAPVWKESVVQLLPELCPDAGSEPAQSTLASEGARRRLFEGTVRLLQAVADRAPVIFCVDDFHRADEATGALVHYLVRRCAEHPLLVILAVEPGEPPGESTLRSPFAIGSRADRVAHMHLSALGPDAIERFIDAYAEEDGIDVPEATRDRIRRLSGGRPLFVLKMLEQFQERGPGAVESDFILLPPSIEAFFNARFRRLGGEAREALAGLAVVGRPASAQVVQSVTGLAGDALIAGAEELVATGIVREADGELRFTTGLAREAAFRSMSGVRRRLLERRAAEVLE